MHFHHSNVFAELRCQFAADLPGRLDAVRAHHQRLAQGAWQPTEAEPLHRLLHNLAGAAGIFGMQPVSDAARQLEIQLASLIHIGVAPSAEEWLAIDAKLAHLDQLARTQPELDAPNLQPAVTAPHSGNSPLIHLVENDLTQAEYLRWALEEDGYQVRVFTRLAEFRASCTALDAERPAAVVMDLVFPEGEASGAQLLAELKAGHARCPPVVIVSMRDDIQARLAAFRAGACRYLVKPVETGRLIGLLDELTGRQPAQPYRVLIVDDDLLLLEAEATILRSAGMEVLTLSQPLRILDVLNDFAPDVVVLDVHMPEATGPELAAVLRERDAQQQLPILFLSAETNMTQQLLALNLGGDDFLVKPVQPDHLVAAVSARARRARQGGAISQRLQATLYEREREHLALDHHAIVSVSDAAGRITYVNDKFCEFSGYSRAELLGQNHRIVKSSEHPPALYQDLWHTISSGKVWEGELCNRRKDGSLYWVESSITPFLDDDGIPYQYVSIRTDITKIKENEAALRAIVEGTSMATGENFFHAAVEGLARSMSARFGFIAEIDPVNTSKLRTLAFWDADHICDNFSFDVANTPCEKKFQDGLCVYPEKVADQFLHNPWLQEKGIECFVAIQLRDSVGTPLGFMGVMHDSPMRDIATKIDRLRIISARVGGEIERKRSEEALRESESRLGFLVSSSPVTIYTCEITPPYAATYLSQNVKRLMGFEPEQFTKNPEFWVDNIHPMDRQKILDELPRLLEQGYHQHEYRFRMNDGSYRWMHDEMLVVWDESGKPAEIIGYWMDITERKRAEEAAEAHKNRLRRGQMYANIGTWDWNIQSGELYWTERIAPLFGYPVGELETSYENFLAAIHPDDRESVIDAVNASVECDAPYEIEHRVVWPDGTVRWLLERGAVARDADGKPLQMLGVVQDIDDRKRAELRLIERERQLREAQSMARIGNWKADLVSGELIWSDEIYRIFGHEPGSFEPSVQAFHAAVHPDDREIVRNSEKLAEQTGRHDVIHRIVRPDGMVRHVHELARMEVDENGRPIQLTGTVQDITERVEADARLRESEAKLSGLFELSPLGIALTDMEGHYLEFNAAFESICGYPAEELKSLDYWTLTPRDYEKQEALQLASLKKTGRYGPYEKVYRQKDGRLIPIRLNGILVEDKNGQSFIWSIVEDISDSKRIEQALIDARDEADRANQAKSEFLSSMSHELRTPMNAVLGFGQLMEYDDTLPEEHLDNVREILKAGHHLLELINEVLDLAKVESGQIDLSLEPVAVCPIVEDCMGLIGPLADRRDIQLSHVGLAGVMVRADNMRLKQALLNLLTNAIKYNRSGGSVRLDVRLVGEGRLRIQVTDTGPGIPVERQAELFQPFNRLDADTTDIEGTGIGLTITQRIVEMMGGVVGVESEVGVGSTFWIELPLESSPDSDIGRSDLGVGSDRAASLQHMDLPQYTVLYIEDNSANIKLVAQILGRQQHIHLLTAHTPELGIELALARRPDLIMLDINMPGMDGYQVLEVFKTEVQLQTIPVVAVTANAMARDIERGKAAGFSDYLTKPIDVASFLELIERCLPGSTETKA